MADIMNETIATTIIFAGLAIFFIWRRIVKYRDSNYGGKVEIKTTDISAKEKRRLEKKLHSNPTGPQARECLEKGINVDCLDEYYHTPLIDIISRAYDQSKRGNFVKFLVANGADVNYQIPEKNTVSKGETPLFLTVREGYTDLVKILLENGADHNRLVSGDSGKHMSPISSDEGSLPVIVASLSAFGDILRMLVENGADVNGRDSKGSTALIQVCNYGGEKHSHGFPTYEQLYKRRLKVIFPLLLELGADINAEDKRGRTGLMCAAKIGYDDMVELLLKNGANLQNKAGKMARAEKGDDVVKELLEEAVNKR